MFLLPWETISIPPKTLRVSEHCYSLAISVENRSSIFSGMSGDTGPHPLLDPALGRLLVGTLYNTLLYKQASDGIPGIINKELGGQRARWENISGNGLYLCFKYL